MQMLVTNKVPFVWGRNKDNSLSTVPPSTTFKVIGFDNVGVFLEFKKPPLMTEPSYQAGIIKDDKAEINVNADLFKLMFTEVDNF